VHFQLTIVHSWCERICNIAEGGTIPICSSVPNSRKVDVSMAWHNGGKTDQLPSMYSIKLCPNVLPHLMCPEVAMIQTCSTMASTPHNTCLIYIMMYYSLDCPCRLGSVGLRMLVGC
jgi:hypothetical protein